MVRKKTTSVGVRGGTPEQHAKAGRLGGLAHHICRGRECTNMKKTATSKRSTTAKTTAKAAPAKKTAAKRTSPISARSTVKSAAKSHNNHSKLLSAGTRSTTHRTTTKSTATKHTPKHTSKNTSKTGLKATSSRGVVLRGAAKAAHEAKLLRSGLGTKSHATAKKSAAKSHSARSHSTRSHATRSIGSKTTKSARSHRSK